MAIQIKHKKVSAVPDSADTSLVRPSDWNDTHDVTGVAASGANSDITSLSGITGGISTANYVAFNTAYTTPLTVGQIGWDGNNTLGLAMTTNVTQEIGLQSYIYGKASSAITKGQLIQKTGAVGGSGVITFAPTSANLTDSQPIIGLAPEDIPLNGFGFIVAFGNLKGFNTTGSSVSETWADGDTLYYNPAGSGKLTKVKPSAPNIKCEIATITNASGGGSGSVAVDIIHGSQLGGTDSNVQLNGVANGNILTYDGTNSYWKNTDLSAGTGISVGKSSTGVLTVTNTAPDQTVAISAGTGISVSGTYPNFTVTNTSPSSGGTVTTVSGTSPISVANGSTTPNISISQASATTNGFLSSTDWTTFNNKGSGTVTSVSASAPISVANGTTTPAISISQASGSTNGFLSSTDWTTFNNKASYPTQTGNAGRFLRTDGTNPSWATLPTVLPVLNRSGSTVSVAVGNGVLPVLTRGGTTVNVAIN